MSTSTLPWAMGLVIGREPKSGPLYSTVTIDPESQLGVFTDEGGAVVPLGKHGTSYDYVSTTTCGGSDGQNPQPPQNDDSSVDVASD